MGVGGRGCLDDRERDGRKFIVGSFVSFGNSILQGYRRDRIKRIGDGIRRLWELGVIVRLLKETRSRNGAGIPELLGCGMGRFRRLWGYWLELFGVMMAGQNSCGTWQDWSPAGMWGGGEGASTAPGRAWGRGGGGGGPSRGGGGGQPALRFTSAPPPPPLNKLFFLFKLRPALQAAAAARQTRRAAQRRAVPGFPTRPAR